jgi:hypothetical protein
MFNYKFENEVIKTYNSNEKNRELVKNIYKINDYDLNYILDKKVSKYEKKKKFNEKNFLSILYDSKNLAEAARRVKIHYSTARKYVEMNNIVYLN